MNFFANLGRAHTTFISKMVEEELSKISLRNRGREHSANARKR